MTINKSRGNLGKHLRMEHLEERLALAYDFFPLATNIAPAGVDIQGTNVFVDVDALFNRSVVAIDGVSGSTIDALNYGDVLSVSNSHLVEFPGDGFNVGFMLDSQGLLRSYNFNIRQVQDVLDVRSLPIDTSQIVDVATGQVGALGGLVLPNSPQTSYGDIDIRERPDGGFDFFFTGQSVAVPFVMRVQFDEMLNFTGARVLAASTAITSPQFNQPRGVAVRDDGVVLTTLPVNFSPSLNFDVPVAFASNFPETGQGGPVALTNLPPAVSLGAKADSDGNFYLTTGPAGSTFNDGISSVVAISADLTQSSLNPISGDVFPIRSVIDVDVNAENIGVVTTSAGELFAFQIPENEFGAGPALPGDFNGDGGVTNSDYLVWRNSFGSTTNLSADANGDGTVNSADYTIWRDNLGANAAAAVLQNAVQFIAGPESDFGLKSIASGSALAATAQATRGLPVVFSVATLDLNESTRAPSSFDVSRRAHTTASGEAKQAALLTRISAIERALETEESENAHSDAHADETPQNGFSENWSAAVDLALADAFFRDLEG